MNLHGAGPRGVRVGVGLCWLCWLACLDCTTELRVSTDFTDYTDKNFYEICVICGCLFNHLPNRQANPSSRPYRHGFFKDTVGKPRDGCVVVIQSLSNKGLR